MTKKEICKLSPFFEELFEDKLLTINDLKFFRYIIIYSSIVRFSIIKTNDYSLMLHLLIIDKKNNSGDWLIKKAYDLEDRKEIKMIIKTNNQVIKKEIK